VVSKSPGRRGARLQVEPLESRRLLSAAGPTATAITPAATVISPDRGWWGGFGGGGFGGGGGGVTNPTPPSGALTPAEISKSYSLSASPTAGAGETIAIVDAYNDPNIKADLATFDAQYGLPAANLTVLNELGQTSGLPPTDPGWSLEIAMDVEWTHASAPGANLVLVEANSTNTADLMQAVKIAASVSNVVSMSWGGGEFQGETAYDSAAYFGHPNVSFVAASGDDGGQSGAEWPAVSPDVISVGGTTLALSNSGGYGVETAWNASGSWWSGYSGSAGGVSKLEPLPSYQAGALGSSYAKGKATPDVSADANPNTGLAVYDSVPGNGATGWSQVGGTSAGAPIWAGIIAAADQARAAHGLTSLGSTQTLSLLYGLSESNGKTSAAYSAAFHDITAGSNFVAKAGAGYDQVTGLGSPIGANIVAMAATYNTATSSARPAAVVATTAPRITAHDVSFTTFVLTVAAVVPPSQLFLPIAPLVPTGPTQVAHASPTTATSATTPTISLTPPPQPLSPSGRSFLASTSDDTVRPLASGAPSRPGLFIDPNRAPSVWQDQPMLAGATPLPLPWWDHAVEVFVSERPAAIAPELDPPSGPPVDTEESAPGLTPAFVASAAFVAWSASEFRSRGTYRNRRRRPFDRGRLGLF
jgi:hypothetical protein